MKSAQIVIEIDDVMTLHTQWSQLEVKNRWNDFKFGMLTYHMYISNT